MRPALTLLAAILLSIDGSSESAAQPRPDEGLPPPMPARIDVRVHLPGSDASRHATASFQNWTIEGCISSVSGSCRRTVRREVPVAARAEMLRIWADASAPILCEPEVRVPGDRAFEVRYLEQTFTGYLPAREADLASRNAGQCRAHARMAMWIANQIRTAPATP